MMKVGIYELRSNGYARLTCEAMAMGARAIGMDAKTIVVTPSQRALTDQTPLLTVDPVFDVAVFWGYVDICQAVLQSYKAVGKKAVYIDLAYWGRDNHFKISVNGRHPTEYFQRRPHDDVRRKMFGIEPREEWSQQGTILVAGMGPKAAWAENCLPVESWEKNAIATIKQFTDRPIIYRPKPSQHYGKHIADTTLDTATLIGIAIKHSWAVVTHHSNVGVDGLVAGVPCFTEQGVAVPMSHSDLSQIESPRYPSFEERVQWLNDVAYVQWSIQEMRSGACWRYLLDEGLV